MYNSLKTFILFILGGILLASCGNGNADTVEKGDIAARVDRFLTAEAKEGFSGAVLIAKDEKIIFAKGYGYADRSRDIPWTIDTVFDITDLTKSITAAAIMKLEMMGKLSTNDTILKYFQRIPITKANIRISQMMTHSSGLPLSTGDAYDPVTRDEYIRLALGSRLPFKPGAYFRYSNVGYGLLGIIIEQVTEGSYEAFIHERLLKPAGMLTTGYLIPEWNRDVMAHRYLQRGEDGGLPLDQNWADDGPYWHLRASGGLLSTLRDLYRWYLALKGTEILSEEAKKEYFTPRISMGIRTPGQYAYGWVVNKTGRNTTVYSHEGSNGVFSADFRWYVDEDVVIIMGANTTDFPVTDYNRQVSDLVFGDITNADIEAGKLLRRAQILDSPMGRYILELLKATASGDEEKYREFIQSRFAPGFLKGLPMEEHMRLMQQMHSELGKAEIQSAAKTGPYACDIVVRPEKTEKTYVIKMTVDPETPHGITGLAVVPEQ